VDGARLLHVAGRLVGLTLGLHALVVRGVSDALLDLALGNLCLVLGFVFQSHGLPFP